MNIKRTESTDSRSSARGARSGKNVTCFCCSEVGHFADACPRCDRAYCHNCRSSRHLTKACRQTTSVKRARSTSKDKGRRSRKRSRGEKSKHSRKSTSRRAPTPKRGNKGRYQSVAREVSGTRNSDSDPDETHRQVRERSSSRDSTPPREKAKSGARRKERSRRIRCSARQVVQNPS